MPEPIARSLCALRLGHGCEERTIRRYDAYENHGAVPTGPICTDLKTSSHFDNFCDFARFRCFHMLHYVKRIPCEEQEQQTIQTPTATPAKDPSLKSQLPQEITTETKPAGVTDKVQYKPMKIKPVTVGHKTTESIKAQSQQQTTPQKKTVGPKLGVDVSKLQANVMPSLKYKNDPVNVQDKAEMLAKPRDEASTVSHISATSIPESTRIQGTEYPKEYQTANDEQNMTEEPEPQDSQLAKSKITVKETQDFKAMDIDETSEESDSDDDIIGFVRPEKTPSSGHETTVTHKPTKAPSHQREMAKVENVKTQQDSYVHKKLNKLEMAWANMIENPANIKGTTRKPQDIEETSEDSDRDNDIIGFAGPKNPPKSGEETIKGIHKTTKAPSHQRAMAKVENVKTQQDSYVHKKLNKLEMAWANMIENPANIKGTTRKPQDIEETSEDSDRDNDIIGFAGPKNPPKSGEETIKGIHKTTKAPSHQRAMAKVENVKTQQDSYVHKKLNKLEMAWANMIENPANIKGTTRKPQDIEETSEDSDRDNDIIGFAGPQKPPE
ncbi:uncharacterized protein LOC108705862 [Xenopus laevis]|uniref:Acrosin-binding protein n=1 Tax=Xenopus laevis TaxID=8355 RepID=A0A8J1LBD6_XENLA|nr:uncharacterized protein LOC108705862 [Xenopus laevis]